MDNGAIDLLVEEIKKIMANARNYMARFVNNFVLITYWHVGRTIVEHE